MGIQTFLRKIRERRERAKAFEVGKKLKDAGKVFISTTSGSVAVPIGSELARSGGVSPRGVTIAQAEALKREREAEARRKIEEAKAKTKREKAAAERRFAEETRKRLEKLAIERRIREQRAQIEANLERSRIATFRANLIREGSKRTSRILTEAGTGNQIKTEVVINNRTGERVVTRRNIQTGKVTTKIFERPQRGGEARQTGGLIQVAKKVKKKIIEEVKKIPKKEIKKKTIRTLDFVTLGFFSKEKIRKSRDDLNKDIESFNKRFGNKTLTEAESKIAERQAELLDKRSSEIDKEQGTLDTSLKARISKALLKLSTGKTIDPESPTALRRIASAEKEIEKAEDKLKNLKGKKGLVVKANRLRLNKIIRNSKTRIDKIESGIQPIALQVTFPVPVSAPGVTKVNFVGLQQAKGGKIITNVVFKSGRKTVGIARGVAITQKGKEVFLTVGKTTSRLTRTGKLIKLSARAQQKFVTLEKGVAKARAIRLKKIQILKIPTKLSRVVLKRITIIKRNLSKLKGKLKQIGGRRGVIKIKGKIRKIKFLTRSELTRQRNILRGKITSLEKGLKQAKIFKRIRRVKRAVRERKFLTRSEKIRQRNIIRQDLSKIKGKLTQIGKRKGIIKIKGKIRKIKLLSKSELTRQRNILRKNIAKLRGELKQFKGIKRVRKIKLKVKEIKTLVKGELNIRKTRLLKRISNLNKKIKKIKIVRRGRAVIRKRKFLLRSELTRQKNILRGRITQISSRLKGLKVVRKIRMLKAPTLKITSFRSIKAFKQKTAGLFIKGKGKFNRIISKANIIPEKDFERIIGKTITNRGDLIKFKGLIKRLGETTDSTSGGQVLRSVQKLSSKQLKSFDQALKKVIGVVGSTAKASKIKGLSSVTKSIISTRAITPIKQKIITKPVKVSPIVSKQNVRLAVKQISIQAKRDATKIKTLQISQTKLKQKIRQEVKQKVKQKLKQRLNQQIRQQVRQQTRQRLRQRLRQLLKQKLRQPIRRGGIRIPLRIEKTLIPPILFKLKRRRKLKKKKKRVLSYNVFARPLKKTKKGKIPKLVKINKVPLSKKRAEDLRNYISDTSLSRTARIKITRGKPQNPKLKIPRGYGRKTSFKFRKFKIRKGKRIKLKIGKVIEKSRHLLDTKQEKEGITLRRRMAQLRKPLKKKVIKRKAVKRITPVRSISKPKRTASPAQLKALAAGRKKLAQLRKQS